VEERPKRAALAYHQDLALLLGSRGYETAVLPFKKKRRKPFRHYKYQSKEVGRWMQTLRSGQKFLPFTGKPEFFRAPIVTIENSTNIPNSASRRTLYKILPVRKISILFFPPPSNLVFNHVIPQLRSIKTPMIIEVDGICIVLAVAVVVGNPNACYSTTINALKPQNKASNALTARALDAVFQACRFRMQKCCALSKSRYSHYISRWPTKYPSCSNGGLLAGLRTSSPQHPILSTPLKQSTPSSH